jgi:hypothetical protein
MADKDFDLTLTIPGKVVRRIAENQVDALIDQFHQDDLEQVGLGTDRKINAFAKKLAADPIFRKQITRSIQETARIDLVVDFHHTSKVYTEIRKLLRQIVEKRLKEEDAKKEKDELSEAIDLLNERGYDVVRKS